MNTKEFNKALTVTSPPHLKNPETTHTLMFDVLIALIPASAWGVYTFGFRALVLILLSMAASVAFEAAYQFFMNIPVTVKDGSALVTGLLLALCLPVSVPLWLPVVGDFFAIIVVKQIFGGIGKNIVNPAIAARVFLFLAWPDHLSRFTSPGASLPLFANVPFPDTVASATPLAALKTGDMPADDLFDIVLGNVGGTIGEVSSVMLIIGGIYLLVRKTVRWQIPVSYIGTVALLSFVFPRMEYTFNFVALELFSGGLLLGAIFMATDYVTSPVTRSGRLIYGAGCGIITVVIRFFGNYPEGVSFAIMIMNLLVWYIDMFTRPKRFGGVEKNAGK